MSAVAIRRLLQSIVPLVFEDGAHRAGNYDH